MNHVCQDPLLSQNEELTELLYLCSCEDLLFQIYYKLVGPMNFEWTRFFGPTLTGVHGTD